MTKSSQRNLSASWSFRDGRINLDNAAGSVLSFRNVSGSVMVDGRELWLDDAERLSCTDGLDADGRRVGTAEYRFADGLRWRWQVRAAAAGRLQLDATLVNASGRDVTVGPWNILHGRSDAGGIVDLGRSPGDVRFFGWRAWSMCVERFAETDGPHDSANLCHLYDPASGATSLLGFVTLDRMQTGHVVQYAAGKGITEYRATCAFGAYRLKAGQELKSETLRFSLHTDPYEALESWADEVHDRYQPSFEGVSGVCVCGDNGIPWPEALESRAKVAGEILKGFGYHLLTGGTHAILKYGLPGNWLTFDAFDGDPDGCEAHLKRLHEKGFTYKFWFSPFWFFGEAEGTLEQNRENLLRDEKGDPITRPFKQGGWEFGRGPYTEQPLTKYFLDGTHPATKTYLQNIFKAYRELGVRAYMLDFLSIIPGAKPWDETLLPLQAARAMLKVIREAAGPDTHFQTAVASTPGFIGCIQSARVVRDFGEARPLHPMPNWRNAENCLHDEHFANAHSFVQNAAAAWFTHGKVYINDLNQMTVDKPYPLEHARITATMFGLSGGSPVVLSDNFQTLAPERLRLVKLCLPRTEGLPVPVDLFDHVAPEGYCHVLKKAVATAWDDYLLVAVFNTSPDNHVPVTQPYNTMLDFARLGLDGAAHYRVYEFWNEEYAGTFRGSFACSVPPDACRLFRISRARPHPWLLSTDLHVEQGNAEIESLSWDEQTRVLKGVARRPAGESGSLFFLMPRQLRLLNHEGTNTMKEVIDMQTVIRLPLVFRTDTAPFELRFEVQETPYISRQGWLPYATETEWLKYVAEHHDPASSRVIE